MADHVRTIGVGVIGTGFIGKAHSIAYSAVSSVFGTGLRPTLEIVCDLSPERAADRAADLGFDRYTDQWQELIDDSDVELISICAPNALHRDISIAALEAGKHVWCEKPMAMSLTNAEDMVTVARSSSRKTIVGYNYIKNPAVTHAQRLISDGMIGRITGFHGRYDVDNEADENQPYSWRLSRDRSGTGAIADILSHLLSVAHFITNSEVSNVVADIDVVHRQRPDPTNPSVSREVDNDDTVAALIHFANGAHGTLGASRVNWGRKCGLRWEVHGSRGTITHDQERLNELRLFTAEDDPSIAGFRTILTGPEHPPYSAFLPRGGHTLGYMDVKICELHQLLQAIENNTRAWPDFEAAVAIERVMDQVERSALERTWLNI